MLDALHQFEIAWIIFIQSLGAWLAWLFQAFTMLGSEEFFMLVMPSLYWCLDGVLGFRVAIMLLLSNGFNCIFKLAFHAPRPFWFDQRIHPMALETSFGLPSGHAQNAISIWGLIAASSKAWSRGMLIALIFLIGFSRLVLGMHFISDVLMGWLLGGLLLWIFLKIERPVGRYLRARSFRHMLALALLSSILIILAITLTRATLGGWQVPDAWTQTILITQPDGVIDPINLETAYTIAGTWFGLMAGAAWYYHRTGGLFDASGAPGHRLLRYVIGVAGILVLWYGLGKVFPRDADILSFSLRYFRYILVGLWISVFAPLLFHRMGLAESRKKLTAPLSVNQNIL